jgi:predicted dehydrogenase
VRNLLERDDVEHIFILTKVDPVLSNFNENEKITFLKPLASSTPDLSCISSICFSKSDFAIIANETSKHMDWAISVGKLGINLLMEKPLSHTLDRVAELQNIVDEMKIKVTVGYNLRFLGIMGSIKEYLSRGLIGDIYFAKIEVGQYLPTWRKDVDYQSTYSADKSLGGGVSLDLSHEIDYMKYLFGFPLSWKIIKGKVSELAITSDDIFEGVYHYNNYLCNVHMDYLQQHKKRECRIVGSKGFLVCDFVKKNLELKSSVNNDIWIDSPGAFDVDETYKIELEQFINTIQTDGVPTITIDDGIDVLKLIDGDYV